MNPTSTSQSGVSEIGTLQDFDQENGVFASLNEKNQISLDDDAGSGSDADCEEVYYDAEEWISV